MCDSILLDFSKPKGTQVNFLKNSNFDNGFNFFPIFALFKHLYSKKFQIDQ